MKKETAIKNYHKGGRITDYQNGWTGRVFDKTFYVPLKPEDREVLIANKKSNLSLRRAGINRGLHLATLKAGEGLFDRIIYFSIFED